MALDRTDNEPSKSKIMCNFIEAYPGDQSQVIAMALEEAGSRKWFDEVDDELIYSQISSPEFRLYEQIILCEA